MADAKTCHRVKCSRVLAPERLVRNAKYCSKQCSDADGKDRSRSGQRSLLSKSAQGARSELAAAVYLVDQGYEVFKALDAQASCDLVVIKGEKVSRVEVRTAMRNQDGSHSFVRRGHGSYDLIVSVCGDEVLTHEA